MSSKTNMNLYVYTWAYHVHVKKWLLNVKWVQIEIHYFDWITRMNITYVSWNNKCIYIYTYIIFQYIYIYSYLFVFMFSYIVCRYYTHTFVQYADQITTNYKQLHFFSQSGNRWIPWHAQLLTTFDGEVSCEVEVRTAVECMPTFKPSTRFEK
jgi:hypothetical protein